HQFLRHYRQPIVLPLGKAIIDRQVAALDVAGFGQTQSQRRQLVRNRRGRTRAEILRMRRERARRRAAEQRHELAPFHCPIAPVLPSERNSTPRAAALRDFRPLNDRYGSWLCRNAPGSNRHLHSWWRSRVGALHFLRSDYALIAAMSGWMPMMFITRVR